jgi:hypothetical protein
MFEYGKLVGQGTQAGGSGHATGGDPIDLGASVGASVTDALNQASAALGVPPVLLLVAALVLVLFALYLVFAR